MFIAISNNIGKAETKSDGDVREYRTFDLYALHVLLSPLKGLLNVNKAYADLL